MELPFFTTTASSSSTTTKAEALRWLAIADKLLAGRDLVGSKSFATRARESDPTLVYADQIIAVADTLLAGDKRINNNQPDWYSILQLPGHRTHDAELIAAQYRKLVLLLNPQKNKLSYADQAFNLVMSAWSVLSNPSRKAMYDNEFMAHLAVNSPSGGGGFNPMFSGGANREQVNYHQQQQQQQPFELNFQVMPQQQHHHQQPPPPAQQGMVTGQVNEMQQLLGGMSREHVNLQLPEQLPHSIPPQLNLSREQIWQSQPPPPPPPQAQPQQPQPQPMQHQHHQPQHQHQPQPQPHHWMDGNLRENFSGSVGGGTNNAQIGSGVRDGAQNENNSNRNVVGGENKEEEETAPVIDDESSFWTACPYCYYMFQYPNDYVECVFKCQNKKCRKAFHGEAIPSPPPIVEGEESYFCCWGTIPLGVSMSVLDRNAGVNGKWTPFSPVFNGPTGAGAAGAGVGNYGGSGNVNFPGGWNANNNNVQRSRSGGGGYTGGRTITGARRAYVEDDVLEYSEPSDESDDDWRNFGRKTTAVRTKKRKHVKRKGAVTPMSGRHVRKTQVDSGKNVTGVGSDTVSGGGFVLQEEEDTGIPITIPNAPGTESIKEVAVDSVKKGVLTESGKKGVAEIGKKGGGNATAAPRRQSARKAKELGRLDLNVEFSNEAEESVGSRASRRVNNASGGGRKVEDIIIEGGGGFFEGLDDFLTSLPILNTVGGDTKILGAEVRPEDVPLLRLEHNPGEGDLFVGGSSESIDDSQNFMISLEDYTCEEEQPQNDHMQKLLDSSEGCDFVQEQIEDKTSHAFSVYQKQVKHEYIGESSKALVLEGMDQKNYDQYVDATDNFGSDLGPYFESDDLMNPLDLDTSAFDMLEEYLAFSDANDGMSDYLTFDPPLVGGSEDLISAELPTSQDVIEKTQPVVSSEQPWEHQDDASSSSRQTLSKYGTDFQQHPFIKQASQMLMGNVHAPPAYASEFPSQYLKSGNPASSSVHVTAGMIQIRNSSQVGSGSDMFHGKDGLCNIMVSFGMSRGDDNSTTLESVVRILPGKAVSALFGGGSFYFMLLSIIALSLSCKMGSFIFAQ